MSLQFTLVAEAIYRFVPALSLRENDSTSSIANLLKIRLDMKTKLSLDLAKG